MADLLTRLWARTLITPSGCWEWRGGCDSSDYGRISVDGRMRATHRIGYAILGPDQLDDDQVLHHLCRNRRCWNPLHLQQVDSRTNTLLGDGPTARHARATQCPQGHDYTEDNTRRARGRRHCRRCSADRKRRARVARRTPAAAAA